MVVALDVLLPAWLLRVVPLCWTMPLRASRCIAWPCLHRLAVLSFAVQGGILLFTTYTLFAS